MGESPPYPLSAMSRLLAVIVAVSLSGCAGQDPAVTPPAPSPGIEHVHGLGVDPADDSLVIATHSGLFRSAAGSRSAARIGDSRQDTMGFTVVGPGRYLGSGHPDLRDDLPPVLGLIASNDAGESWQPLSLLGEADFHVLRASGRRVYGVNSTDGRLLVSADAGETWRHETPPEPLIDLVLHPGDPRKLVATGERGLYLSRDAGATWRPLAVMPAGLLAWPSADRLLLLDGSGTLHVSRDTGRRFREVGRTGVPPAAFAADGTDLYVAGHDNRILASRDGGQRWRLRVGA